MTLQRRLLALLLVAVPVIWAVAVAIAVGTARREIDEMFDTELVRYTQQVIAVLPASPDGIAPPPDRADPPPDRAGRADFDDMAFAAWAPDGRVVLADREGRALPFRREPGFASVSIAGQPWSVYYQASENGAWWVAVGQKEHEREEVVQGLMVGQLLPWLLMLPVLLVAMTLVVRHALKPVHALAHEIESRGPDDLEPVSGAGRPRELEPLVASMNRLFARIGRAIETERRFTADAAHELRTPLAAVRAQWEASRVAGDAGTREAASRRVGEGLDRLNRVVAQLLALSSVDARDAAVFTQPVDWPRVVAQALSDCLPLIEAREADVAVEWPDDAAAPLPLAGDESLLTLLVRNLVDNAIRYGGARPTVRVRFAADRLVVEDDGPGLPPAELARVGDRFYRPAGQEPSGSGLGLSIARRVADLHGMALALGPRDDGRRGLRAVVARAAAASASGG
jgi:two-component system sensor histidine kinase QseC